MWFWPKIDSRRYIFLFGIVLLWSWSGLVSAEDDIHGAEDYYEPVSAESSSAQGSSLSERRDQIYREVNQRYGRFLGGSRSSELVKYFQEIFERLSESQRNLFDSRLVPFNRLKIYESSAPNAFVVTLNSPGAREVENLAFISTGLIEMFFPFSNGKNQLSQEDLKRGEIRTAGVLAHELAHPLADLDREGSKHPGILARWSAGTANEFRADGEGALIAEGAGYPREAVLSALEVFKQIPLKKKNDDFLLSLRSTHPPTDSRVSVHGSLLTALHYRKGKHDQTFPKPVKRPVRDSLVQLKLRGSTGDFVAPRSLMDLRDRFISLYKDDKKNGWDWINASVEFNRLLLWFDHYLKEQSKASSKEDWAIILEIVEVLMPKRDSQYAEEWLRPFSSEEKLKLMTFENGSRLFLNSLSHSELLGDIAIFRDPRILKKLTQYQPSLSRDSRSDEKMVWRFLERLRIFLPFTDLRIHFGGFLREALSKVDLDYGFKDFESRSNVFDNELKFFYLNEVIPRIQESGNYSSLFSYSMRAMKWLLPLVESSLFHDQTAQSKSLTLSEDERLVVSKIWDQAGFWAVFEFSHLKQAIDWKLIWRVLGIPEVQGRQQLTLRALEFYRSENMKKLSSDLSGYEESKQKGTYGYRHDFNIHFQDRILDETFFLELRGDCESSDADRRSAAQMLLRRFLIVHPEFFDREYEKQIEADIQSFGLASASEEDFNSLVSEIHQNALKRIGVGSSFVTPFPIDRAWAQAIDRSTMPRQTKKALLVQLFSSASYSFPDVRSSLTLTRDFQASSDSMSYVSFKLKLDQGEVWNILKKNNVVSSAFDTLKKNILDTRYASDYQAWFDALNRTRSYVSDELKVRLMDEPLSQKERVSRLLEYARIVFDPLSTKSKSGRERYQSEIVAYGNSQELQVFKKTFIEWADSLSFPISAKRDFFNIMTATGPSVFTDLYFERHFLAEVKSLANRNLINHIESLLDQKRLHSSVLRVQLARKILVPEIDALGRKKVLSIEVKDILDRINRWIPEGSKVKDELLEEMSWKLHLRGNILSLVEDYKSYNWKAVNPILAKLTTVISDLVNSMTLEGRKDLLKYILNPEKNGMPEFILNRLRSDLEQTLKSRDADLLRQSDVRDTLLRELSTMKYLIEKALMDSQPEERVPLMALILSLGEPSLINSDEFPLGLSREFLKYPPNSKSEKLFSSFVRIIPDYQKAPTLAYLMAQARGGAVELENIYAAFGPPGFKAAQYVARWNLFGEEHSEKIKTMRYKSNPLTLEEVEKRAMKSQDFDKIAEFVRPLGSASNWMAVLVKLKNGKYSVLMVQRPNADSQINGSIDLAHRYLEHIHGSSTFEIEKESLDMMLSDLKFQMREELKGTSTKDKIAEAASAYENLNQEFQDFDGFTFKVPGLMPGFQVYDDLFFLEFGDGSPFDELSIADQKLVGPSVVKASLRMRYRKGKGDADRHRGNFLVNMERKEIQPLDFGWWYSWTEKDIEIWAKFLQAFALKQVANIVDYSVKMSLKGVVDGATRDLLITEVQASLKTFKGSDGKGTRDLALSLIRIFEKNGVHWLPKFKFGGLMELLTLQGENYVPESEFKSLLAQEVLGASMRCLTDLRGFLPGLFPKRTP